MSGSMESLFSAVTVLPVEIQCQILGYLNRGQLEKVCRSSPQLNDIFRNNTFTIRKLQLLLELRDELLQDAMALVEFPTITPEDIHVHKEHRFRGEGDDFVFPCPAGRPMNKRSQKVNSHLMKWAAGEMPNPFHKADPETMGKLDRLCQQIWLFTSDFLAKATSYPLETTLTLLPAWAHSTFTAGGFQAQQRQTGKLLLKEFPEDGLTPQQETRLMRAFIRYEILCKIYRPVAGAQELTISQESSRRCACRRVAKPWKVDRFGPFRSWDWHILAKYKGDVVELKEDAQLMVCVREYVKNVYHAALLTYKLNEASTPQKLDDTEMEDDESFENEDIETLYRIVDAPRVDARNLWPYRETNRSTLTRKYHLPFQKWRPEALSMLTTMGLGTLANCLRKPSNVFWDLFKHFEFEISLRKEMFEPTSPDGRVVDRDRVPWYCGRVERLRRQRAAPLFNKPGQKWTGLREWAVAPEVKLWMDLDAINNWKGGIQEDEDGDVEMREGDDENGGEDEDMDRDDEESGEYEAIAHGAHRALQMAELMVKEAWEEGDAWDFSE